MATLSSLAGGSIKSIQRGVTDITAVSTVSVTISAVNTAKSEVRFLGQRNTLGDTSADATVQLLNSTTIYLMRGTATGVTTVSWEITEYN